MVRNAERMPILALIFMGTEEICRFQNHKSCVPFFSDVITEAILVFIFNM
jgi:hypothetical protein